MKTNRRTIFKRIFAGTLGILGLSLANANPLKAGSDDSGQSGDVIIDQDIPLFSSSQTYGGLVYIAGIGAHFEGDITSHTAHVLEEMKKQLEKAGSSMDRVLKVNVYLNDIKEWKAMNAVFHGKFGKNPPVRTTIAAPGGIPGDSLVEMDCIAALNAK